MSSRVLCVWDFDHSLVNDNSDTWVVQTLRPDLMSHFKDNRTQQGLGWTEIMHRQMENLWKDGVVRQDIDRVMTELPLQPRMLDTVKLIQQLGATQVIVSDANTHFIDVILAHHGICDAFQSIHTNSARFAPDGRLHVSPHHAAVPPHGCPLCPPNLCKGSVLDTLRSGYDRVIYVGDGGGDYCPATRLCPADLVLARHSAAKAYGLWDKLCKSEPGRIAARTQTWETGEDLYAIFSAELEAQAA